MVWDVGAPLIDFQGSPFYGGSLKQILVSSKYERVLLNTNVTDTLWPMSQPGSGCIAKIDTAYDGIMGPTWTTCPHPDHAAGVLLRFINIRSEIYLHDWATLNLLRLVRLSGLSSRLSKLAPSLSHPHYYATWISSAVLNPIGNGNFLRPDVTGMQFWDYETLGGAGAQPPVPSGRFNLKFGIGHLIGMLGARLIFLTGDHWIASCKFIPPGLPENDVLANASFVRHFFLPNDWIVSVFSGDLTNYIGIGVGGEIIVALQGELIVIKRGLEVTEDGERFQPRELSSKPRITFAKEEIPFRETGIP